MNWIARAVICLSLGLAMSYGAAMLMTTRSLQNTSRSWNSIGASDMFIRVDAWGITYLQWYPEAFIQAQIGYPAGGNAEIPWWVRNSNPGIEAYNIKFNTQSFHMCHYFEIAGGWPMRAVWAGGWNFAGVRSGYFYGFPASPIWLGVIVNTMVWSMVIFPVTFLPRCILRFVRKHAGHCSTCGYNLRGLPRDICPECGTKQVFVPASA